MKAPRCQVQHPRKKFGAGFTLPSVQAILKRYFGFIQFHSWSPNFIHNMQVKECIDGSWRYPPHGCKSTHDVDQLDCVSEKLNGQACVILILCSIQRSWTPLMIATLAGYADIVDYLVVQKKADFRRLNLVFFIHWNSISFPQMTILWQSSCRRVLNAFIWQQNQAALPPSSS